MPKERRLTKIFTASRLKELTTIPLSWHVRRVLDQTFCEADLRVAELHSFRKQCGYLFDVSHSRNITKDSSEVQKAKPDTSTEDDTADQWFRNPSCILKLDLSLNNLASLDIVDLEFFSELRSLDASLNEISHFSGVLACTQLTSLCLAYNNISHLPMSALEQCKYLHNMDLRSNQISDLSNFASLPNLEILNVSHNQLKTLDGLQALRSLRKLSAQDNKLESIVSICACTDLQQMDLSLNQIATLHSLIEVVKHLSQLQQLDVQSNPFVVNECATKIHEEVTENTTVTLLNGINVRSLKDQFADLPISKPPPANETLKVSLKEAVRDVMWQNLKTQEKKHESYLRYLHKKLLNMIVDMEEFREQSALDTEAWCTYIDTLSSEEVNGLSVSKIRALALASPDGSSMKIDEKFASKRPAHHKK